MKDVRLVVDRYARALSGAVKDGEEFARVRDELASLARVLRESPELRRVLANPVVSPEAKTRVVLAIADRMNLQPITRRFLEVVGRHERLLLLPEIAAAVGREADRREGVQEVELRAATALPDDVRDRLEEALRAAAGGTIRLREAVDPDLLGGLVARIGGTVIDGSLKTRLERLRARLRSDSAAGLAG